LITADVVRAAAEQPREQPRKPPNPELVNVLREHLATLKADNERLNGDLVAERQRADRAIAGLTALARERTAARQANPGAARGRSGGGGQGHGRAGRPGAAARRDRSPRAATAKQT